MDARNPELHTCMVRFLKYRQERLAGGDSSPVLEVIDKELTKHLSTLDPVQINEDFLNRFLDSAPHRLQGQ